MVALKGLLRPAVAAMPIASLNNGSLLKRETSISSGCGTSGSLSCSSDDSGTCCFEGPGGLIVQTQFWDTDPSTGPSDGWTIHGLWPDNCDGTYSQNCDSSREYTDISGLLSDAGADDTLSYMETHWLNNAGSDEELWEHEWAKHGTCYSTLQTDCLPDGSEKGDEAVAFFETTVSLFKTLPTYDWLSNQGIEPSSSKTYTLDKLTSALKEEAGVTPALDCDGDELYQVYWYFHLKGSVIDGDFEAISAPEDGSCGSSGIKYLPKD